MPTYIYLSHRRAKLSGYGLYFEGSVSSYPWLNFICMDGYIIHIHSVSWKSVTLLEALASNPWPNIPSSIKYTLWSSHSANTTYVPLEEVRNLHRQSHPALKICCLSLWCPRSTKENKKHTKKLRCVSQTRADVKDMNGYTAESQWFPCMWGQ